MQRLFVAAVVGVLAAVLFWSPRRSPAAEAGFAWEETPGDRLDLLYDGRPAVRYMFHALDESTPATREATFKPYHHVFSPDGEVLLTNGAGAALYPHHHGVFYGFRAIKYHGDQECDVWHCLEKAYTSHERELSREADAKGARHVAAIDWHGRSGEVFAHEQRAVSVRREKHGGADGWLIDFHSRLETADGRPVHLDGDPQHAGFHFRAAPEEIGNLEPQENAAKQIYYLRTDGKGPIGQTRNWDHEHPDDPANADCVSRPWNAMSFMLRGKRYTVLYMDSPQNPKPARSSERAYGRFGSYFVADVTKEKPLDVKYRLWVQEGEMTVEECQALYDDFIGGK